MLDLCARLGARAREAASRGDVTFAVPEAADAATWVATRVLDSTVRAQAKRWSASGATYHSLIRLCARAVVDLDPASPSFEPRYRGKVEGELESMLSLWPDVLLLPTASPLSARDMVLLRAYPVHPLGLADGMPWTDGKPSPPSEYFFHDLDHARFKVREDLLAAGIALPDAYVAGSTLDPLTGRHRTILPFAIGRIGMTLWDQVATRTVLAHRLFASFTVLDDEAHAAADLLLFEVVHEKSFPLDPVVLDRELGNELHIAKLRQKAAAGFFPNGVEDAVIDALPRAQVALRKAFF